VVVVGVTVQVGPVVPAHVPPVHTNDVAAGLQFGVSTEVLPEVIDAGDALKLQLGAVGAVTVTVAYVAVDAPVTFVPTTE
jgi:hypothetical protein